MSNPAVRLVVVENTAPVSVEVPSTTDQYVRKPMTPTEQKSSFLCRMEGWISRNTNTLLPYFEGSLVTKDMLAAQNDGALAFSFPQFNADMSEIRGGIKHSRLNIEFIENAKEPRRTAFYIDDASMPTIAIDITGHKFGPSLENRLRDNPNVPSFDDMTNIWANILMAWRNRQQDLFLARLNDVEQNDPIIDDFKTAEGKGDVQIQFINSAKDATESNRPNISRQNGRPTITVRITGKAFGPAFEDMSKDNHNVPSPDDQEALWADIRPLWRDYLHSQAAPGSPLTLTPK